MDTRYEILSSTEALEMLAKTAGITRDEATRIMAAGADGGIPSPKKYSERPTFYRSDELLNWVNRYGKKLKKPKLAVDQA